MGRSRVGVLTVGTSAEPILHTLRGLAGQVDKVWLLYGRALGEQRPSPLDVAQTVAGEARELGIEMELREVAAPENLDGCIRAVRGVLEEVEGVDRVLVDFTGGTKVLAAGAVHAALTAQVAAEIELAYTGGVQRDGDGRVVSEAMAQRVITVAEQRLHEAVALVLEHRYREAHGVVARLAHAGRSGYVRTAVEALLAWEDFDYETAVNRLHALAAASDVLAEDRLLGPLARLCRKLRPVGGGLSNLVGELRRLDHPRGSRKAPWDSMPLLVADTLENAARRLREGRCTDCVLRAYRAVEVAVHGALLQRGISPKRTQWQDLAPAARERARNLMRVDALPGKLNLFQGLMTLAALGHALSPELEGPLKDLQKHRNDSYLEHGYLKITEAAAAKRLAAAERISAALMQVDPGPLRAQVRHAVEPDA